MSYAQTTPVRNLLKAYPKAVDDDLISLRSSAVDVRINSRINATYITTTPNEIVTAANYLVASDCMDTLYGGGKARSPVSIQWQKLGEDLIDTYLKANPNMNAVEETDSLICNTTKDRRDYMVDPPIHRHHKRCRTPRRHPYYVYPNEEYYDD